VRLRQSTGIDADTPTHRYAHTVRLTRTASSLKMLGYTAGE
jgi:hypothetical protein